MYIPYSKIDMEDEAVEHNWMNAKYLNSILLMMPILTKLVPSQHIYVFYEVKPFIVNRLIYANYISYNAEYD